MRYELVPDTPCPHCERPNTTLRRSIEEDGFTKVSRICIACHSEWTHTWDRDWLADAKNKKLRADNERLRAKIKWLIEDDERLYYVLYRIANPRPFADCPVEMAQNATRGEHLRIEAFDGIRRMLEDKP